MFKKRHYPLRYTIPAVLLVVMLLAELITYSYNKGVMSEQLERYIEQEVKSFSLFLHQSELAFHQGGLAYVQDLFTERSLYPFTRAIYMVDEKGMVYWATNDLSVGQRYETPSAWSKDVLEEGNQFIVEREILLAHYPLILASPDSAWLGSVYIQLDIAHEQKRLEHRVVHQSLVSSGIFILLAILIWLFFNRVVAVRIGRLQKMAYAIGDGDFAVRVHLTEGDEIGELALGLNKMAEKIEIQKSHRAALQQALDKHAIISIVNPSGHITYVNDRFCEVCHYSRSELIGKNIQFLESKKNEGEFYKILCQTSSAGQIWQGEIKNKTKGGKFYWLQYTIVPFFDEMGDLQQYISVGTDITRRERIRLAMEKLATASLGSESYKVIANALCLGLNSRWAGVGRLSEDGCEVHVLGFWENGSAGENFSYELSGTPCESVCTHDAPLVVPEGVTKLYPSDQMLIDIGAESYRGEPLIDDDGLIMGVIFVIDDHYCTEDESDRALLRMASERAALEIKRVDSEESLNEYRNHLEELVANQTEALLKNNKKLESIIENLPAIFYMKDLNGLYQMVNRHFEIFVGMSKKTIIGQTDEAIFPNEDSASIIEQDYRVMNGTGPISMEEQRMLASGHSQDYLTTKIPLLDDKGECYGLVGIMTDVTNMKGLQRTLSVTMSTLERQASIEHLMSGITSQLIGIKPDTLGIEIREALRKIGEFIGADRCSLIEIDARKSEFSITQQWHIEGIKSSQDLIQDIPISSQIYLIEMLDCGMPINARNINDLPDEAESLRKLIRQGGAHSVLMLPVSYGGVLRGILSLESMQTTPGWDEDELELSNTQGVLLGQVLQSMDTQKALRESKEEAENLARVKSEFLANMSHEIRTPLNAVLGLAQVGSRDSQGRKSQQSFQRILDSGKHLLALVNDILDFSKFEAGKFSVENILFNLGDVIDKSIGFVSSNVYEKGILLRVLESDDLPEQLLGDPMRLIQVLSNLLSNALKFTSHGEIILEVVRNDSLLEIKITDTGIGMSEEQLSRLFTPFEQADTSTTRRFGGSGLGLAISARLVQGMGGTISVSSVLNEGTIFEISLPITGAIERKSPISDCSLLQSSGLSDREMSELREVLKKHDIEIFDAPIFETLNSNRSKCVLLAANVFENEAVVEVTLEAIRRGTHVAVFVVPGQESLLPESLQGQISIVDWPIRLRCLILKMSQFPNDIRGTGEQRLAGLSILAVEDTELNRIVLQDLLEHEHADVVFAENGQIAVDLIAESDDKFDIVLMDIQMPVMDGYEATRRIKKLKPNLPVVGLTAHAFPEERMRCKAAGMVEHVSKPIDIDILITAILAHVEIFTPVIAKQNRVKLSSATTLTTDCGGLIIDWQGLNKRFSNRTEFINKLLVTVLDSYSKTPDEIRSAVKECDFEKIAFVSHRIKGVAGNIMASQVEVLSKTIEADARKEKKSALVNSGELAVRLEYLLSEIDSRVNS